MGAGVSARGSGGGSYRVILGGRAGPYDILWCRYHRRRGWRGRVIIVVAYLHGSKRRGPRALADCRRRCGGRYQRVRCGPHGAPVAGVPRRAFRFLGDGVEGAVFGGGSVTGRPLPGD